MWGFMNTHRSDLQKLEAHVDIIQFKAFKIGRETVGS